MSRECGGTASITVAFNPDPHRLEKQLALLALQVDDVIVVDNGSSTAWRQRFADRELVERLHVIELPENIGISGGLNTGLKEAYVRGAEFALLMDHDSIAPLNTVATLRHALLQAEKTGTRVAAVGPIICDERDHRQSPFIQLRWMRHVHKFCNLHEEIIPTDFLISSGCFARLSSYLGPDAVGLLDEELFIDSVDFEWCCRARASGFGLFGVCAATLDHRLGDSRKAILPGFSMIVHSPDRLYYMTRNRISLYARAYVPLRWKWKDFFRMLAKLTLTLIFLTPRMRYLSRSFSALKDAGLGRAGRKK